jgi:hypothetical protein
VLAVLLVPAVAVAQVVTVGNATTPEREPDPIGHDTQTWISAADCRANSEFRYRVTTGGVGGESLEVWAGTTDCTLREARVGVNRSCWLVLREAAVINTTRFYSLRAQDMVARNPSPDREGGGSIESCRQQIGVSQKEPYTLYFMLVNSNFDVIPGASTNVQFHIDLVGPAPPTGVTAGVGEERLILKWDKGSRATDLLGYSFYCAPVTTTMQGDAGPVGAGGAPDAAGGATGTGGVSGVGGTAGLGDAGPTDGAAGDGTAGTGIGGGGGTDAGTTEGGVGNDSCPSPLRSQTVPDPAFLCGTASSTAVEGEATGLVNNQLYAVGVAARDELDNPGLMSEIQCGTPQEVDDFYEVYKRAGGRGGGGFCSFGADPAAGAGLLLAAAALAHFLRRRAR